LADCPYKFTTITALGRLPTSVYFSKALRKACGDIFHVSISESINTGVAFLYKIGLEVAQNVKEEQSTISPSLTPHSINAKCKANVPLPTAKACSTWT